MGTLMNLTHPLSGTSSASESEWLPPAGLKGLGGFPVGGAGRASGGGFRFNEADRLWVLFALEPSLFFGGASAVLKVIVSYAQVRVGEVQCGVWCVVLCSVYCAECGGVV